MNYLGRVSLVAIGFLSLSIFQYFHPDFWLGSLPHGGRNEEDKDYDKYQKILQTLDKNKNFDEWQFYQKEIERINANRRKTLKVTIIIWTIFLILSFLELVL